MSQDKLAQDKLKLRKKNLLVAWSVGIFAIVLYVVSIYLN
jgi:hypothetical protein